MKICFFCFLRVETVVKKLLMVIKIKKHFLFFFLMGSDIIAIAVSVSIYLPTSYIRRNFNGDYLWLMHPCVHRANCDITSNEIMGWKA